MRDVRGAMAVLGERAGVPGLAPDAEGRAALEVPGAFSVYLLAAGEDDAIELCAFVPSLDEGSEGRRYMTLLRASLADTGEARFGLDEGGRAVLCERLELTGLDDDALERRTLHFIKRTQRWRETDVGALATAYAPTATIPTQETMLRV